MAILGRTLWTNNCKLLKRHKIEEIEAIKNNLITVVGQK